MRRIELDVLLRLGPGEDPPDVRDLADAMVGRPEWMERASCRRSGTADFFTHEAKALNRARQMCMTCPVHAACLRYALDDPTLQGTWSGTTAKERRAIRKAAG